MRASTEDVYSIIEKGLEGNGLTPEETLRLYQLDPASKESALLRWAGQKLSLEVANGKAEIHAQIGLNSTVCPNDCWYCSFASINGARKGKYEIPKEDVIEYAKIYEEDGANLILLLTTATYKFDKLVEMVQAVREVISPDMPLLVNTEDMTLERARILKDAGAQGAYHAVRMREGVETGIPVENRMRTFEYMAEAGLKLSSCVEPVGPEHTPEELTEATFRCIHTHPLTAGVGKRIPVPGTKVYDRGELTDLANANYVAVYRLATGRDLRLNCSANSSLIASAGANLAWAEVGTNPRDLVERTENGGEGSTLAEKRAMFENAGWEVLEGPSQGWF